MKRTLTIILLTIFAFGLGYAENKNKQKAVTIYAYGVSTCFNDTIAYITDVMEINDAFFIPKSKGFIGGRHEYSQQLKEYFTANNMPNQTCAFFFATKKDTAEKRYLKLLKRLKEKNKYNVVPLTRNEFTFKAIKYEDLYGEE